MPPALQQYLKGASHPPSPTGAKRAARVFQAALELRANPKFSCSDNGDLHCNIVLKSGTTISISIDPTGNVSGHSDRPSQPAHKAAKGQNSP